MTDNKFSAMRGLDDAELDQVAGGECTCGNGAACITHSYVNGSTTVVNTNCSGTIVYYGQLEM